MTNISLGQAWVSRVTKSDLPDAPVTGGDRSSVPSAEQLQDLLHRLALSDAAREMVRRKWFQPKIGNDKIIERGKALYEFLFAPPVNRSALAMFRGRRANTQLDLFEEISIKAWIAHVTDTAKSLSHGVSFDASQLNEGFFHRLAKLSSLGDGPKKAFDAIRKVGINVVIEDQLPGMSVDGASFHIKECGPVLAMTLRYDRLDNFWFTLMHELGHIALHLVTPSDDVFIDSMEDGAVDDQEVEAEADAFAQDNLIPRDTWLRSDARRVGDEKSVVGLAKQLGISPAIVAGRIRFERKEFRIFSDLVGNESVRDIVLKD